MVLSGSGGVEKGGESVQQIVLGPLEIGDVLLELGLETLHGLGVA